MANDSGGPSSVIRFSTLHASTDSTTSFAFLPGARSLVRGHESWLARTLKARFARDLPRALDHPRLVMLTSAALLLTAAVAMTRMGTAFLPEFNEGTLTIQANTMPGTSLPKSDQI